MPRRKRSASAGVAEATAAAKGRKKTAKPTSSSQTNDTEQVQQVQVGPVAYATGPPHQQNETGAEACASAPLQGGTNFIQQLVESLKQEMKEIRDQQMALQVQMATLLSQHQSTPNTMTFNRNPESHQIGTQNNQMYPSELTNSIASNMER